MAPVSGWNQLEVGEVSAGVVSCPETDQSFPSRAQLADDQAGLVSAVHEHAHLRAGNHDADTKPAVGIRYGRDGVLVLARMLRTELLPRVVGMRDVLHGSLSSLRIFRPEVERTEVDGVI